MSTYKFGSKGLNEEVVEVIEFIQVTHLLLNSLLNKFLNLYPLEHIKKVYFSLEALITNTFLENLGQKLSSLDLYCIIHISSMILVSEYITKHYRFIITRPSSGKKS